MHLVAYGGRNDQLFVGGMAESIFFPAQPFVGELEYQFDRLVNQTGCIEVALAEQMACLRSKDVSLLQAANVARPFPGRTEPPMPLFYWTPCVDGEFLQDLPYRLFEKGQFVNVPMVLGTSTNGASLTGPLPPTPLVLHNNQLTGKQKDPSSPPTLPAHLIYPSSSATTTPS
jgi:hypothetical protein